MISALYRYPKYERRVVAKEWARRSNAMQSVARTARSPDEDTVRRRALHDARGQVVREGATYRASGVTHWIVRRSIAGRTNQFDFVSNGRVMLTAGPRRFPLWCRVSHQNTKPRPAVNPPDGVARPLMDYVPLIIGNM